MPRLIRQTPKYRKHKASGQAFVELNGHRHYLGPHGTKTSHREYDRLVAEWLASGRSASFGVPEHSLTIVELLVDYLKHAASYHGTDPRGEYPQIVRAVRPSGSSTGAPLPRSLVSSSTRPYARQSPLRTAAGGTSTRP